MGNLDETSSGLKKKEWGVANSDISFFFVKLVWGLDINKV